MITDNRPSTPPPKWDEWDGKPGAGSILFASGLLVAAAAFACYGFYAAQSSDLALASRALIWISGAIALGIGAMAQALFAVRAAILATMTARLSSDGTLRWAERDKAQSQPASDNMRTP